MYQGCNKPVYIDNGFPLDFCGKTHADMYRSSKMASMGPYGPNVVMVSGNRGPPPPYPGNQHPGNQHPGNQHSGNQNSGNQNPHYSGPDPQVIIIFKLKIFII
jgi:hypothetical protein